MAPVFPGDKHPANKGWTHMWPCLRKIIPREDKSLDGIDNSSLKQAVILLLEMGFCPQLIIKHFNLFIY